MGAGKRRQIRKQICDILTDFVTTAYSDGKVEGSNYIVSQEKLCSYSQNRRSASCID